MDAQQPGAIVGAAGVTIGDPRDQQTEQQASYRAECLAVIELPWIQRNTPPDAMRALAHEVLVADSSDHRSRFAGTCLCLWRCLTMW
jgi:hypothetical protein